MKRRWRKFVKNIGKEKIENLLKEYNITEVSEILGVKYHNLYHFIRKNEIPYKNYKEVDRKGGRYAEGAKSRRKLSSDQEKQICDMYVKDKLSVTNIAESFPEVNRITIFNILKRNKVKMRLQSGAYTLMSPKLDKETLEKWYIKERLSSYQICDMYPTLYNSHASVVEDLKAHNIYRRGYSSAGKAAHKTNKKFYNNNIKHLEAIRNKCFKENPSSLEVAFMDWAKEEGIMIEHQFQLYEGGHNYDFKLTGTKILIETDGDYWHSSEEAIKRDKMFDKIAEKHGYTVIRVLGSEIKKHGPSIFEEKLRAFYE